MVLQTEHIVELVCLNVAFDTCVLKSLGASMADEIVDLMQAVMSARNNGAGRAVLIGWRDHARRNYINVAELTVRSATSIPTRLPGNTHQLGSSTEVFHSWRGDRQVPAFPTHPVAAYGRPLQ